MFQGFNVQMEFTLVRLISLFLLFHLTLNSAHKSNHSRHCSSFNCGTNGQLSFPFSNLTYPECGFFVVNCTESTIKVRFQDGGEWYTASGIDYNQLLIGLDDEKLKSCDALNHFSIPTSQYLSLNMTGRVTSLIKCKRNNSRKSHQQSFRSLDNYTGCKDYEVYYYTNPNKTLPSLSKTDRFSCSNITLPPNDLATWLPKSKFPWGSWFLLQWKVPLFYYECHKARRFFRYINGTIRCKGRTEETKSRQDNKKKKIAIGVGTSIGLILLACVFFLFHKKLCSKSSALISRTTTPDSSLKPEYEKGSSYFQTPIFTYNELKEATNNFDLSKELGDGGFGTVYRGNLRDGRVVAVKRLYENNYKRVEQFMNEITIFSGLHHQNLVTLCGCTSTHSRELLLVYEYVPNGTVAYHLYGDHAVTSPLSWPVRMSIAIETADALTYLHASDTIHRDVKTNNILLDNNYHVKVADFGLSRLFPTDATHISTAPQGTPGYVDPAYYQCYQLNDKSDVYSFGVVLIELISSKPAVDINRRQDEINLSNMAINKIHNDALHELVDPSLGFETNYTVRMMITMVAELAFRCLQLDKDMRPSMSEVLQSLKEIQRDDFKMENAEELDIRADARLLKNFSPTSVTNEWVSNSTVSNTSF